MLQELSIKNFAIIDDLNICFSGGLTILSGETGAGKSIIINAVNLLLGSRASSRLVRTGAEAAELEAMFQVTPESKTGSIMKKYGFDPAEGLLIRRIISVKDRHRIYINGRLATIQMLVDITDNLASISGQHTHQGLLKEDQHLLIIDQFGGLIQLRIEVKQLVNEIFSMLQTLNKLISRRDAGTEHYKLLEYQQKEIFEASISPGEDAQLEQERMRIKNGEVLFQSVNFGVDELYAAPGAVAERLAEVKNNIVKASRIDPELSDFADQLAAAIYQIEDIAGELRTYLKNIHFDENRLEEIEARLDTINKLKRKYGKSLDALFSHFESISSELSTKENISDKIEEAETTLDRLHNSLAEKSIVLSKKRKETAARLAGIMETALATLKMPRTKFDIALSTIPADHHTAKYLITGGNVINESGIDHASFLIAPNVGEDLKPFSSIVSGGELSRVVLALKEILIATESVETVVFDEVDAGIGGGVAEVVGKKLYALADLHQVVCITHLPQIAKFGDHHFKISKHVSKGMTKTLITPVRENERVKEIARMLGGETITSATLDHAREMLADKNDYS